MHDSLGFLAAVVYVMNDAKREKVIRLTILVSNSDFLWLRTFILFIRDFSFFFPLFRL